MPGCPIRKSTDQIICADPRGLSQLITSFIASESLGIHRVPLFTFFSAYPFASICGCFLFCYHPLQNITILSRATTSLLLSSLIFFFQYVKERSGTDYTPSSEY